MATKAEERKALEQIRKIVNGLGEDSYLAMAFDGCFEDAEANINEDAAYSYKNRYDNALTVHNKLVKELQDANTARVKAIEESKLSEQMGQKYFESWQSAEKDIENLEAELESFERETKKAANEWNDKVIRLTKTVEDKDKEVMKLKAKVYDLMMKDAE